MTAPLIAEIQRQHQESRQLYPQAQAAHPVPGVSQTLLDSRLAEFSLQTIQELQYTRDALRARIDALAHEVGLLRDLAPALQRIEQYSHASARRVALPCGNDEILVRTAAGFVVCPASDAALLATLMEGGELRPGTHRLIQRLLGPNSTFVDVGASIGLHTLAAGYAMQKKGRIVAFEPVPETCRLLRKTLQINGITQKVDVREAAASDRGVAALLQALNPRDPDAPQDSGKGAGSTHPGHIRFERIDDVLGVGAHVDLMSFDVKGAEPDVLAGARDTIAVNTDIGLIVTCKASHIERADLPVQDWLKAFQALGLELGVVNEDTGAVEPQSSLEFSSQDPVSLFFARPGSPTWTRALAP